MIGLLLPLLVLGCGDEDKPVSVGAPVEASVPVFTVSNTSEGTWKGVELAVDGEVACTLDELPKGAVVNVEDGACEVTLPEVTTVVKASAGSGGSADEPAPLKGWAQVVGVGPARVIKIRNDNDFDWTGCSIGLDGTWFHKIAKIPRNTDDSSPLGKFKDGSGGTVGRGTDVKKAVVRCNEGTGVFNP